MSFKRFAGRDESNGRRWLSRLVGSPFCSTHGCGAFRIRSQLLRVAKAHRVRIRRFGDFDDIFQVKNLPDSWKIKVVKSKKPSANMLVSSLLKTHFGDLPLHGLVTASRVFPSTARVDLQVALDRLFTTKSITRKLVGVHVSWGHETLTFSHLIVKSDHPALVGPLQLMKSMWEKVSQRAA